MSREEIATGIPARIRDERSADAWRHYLEDPALKARLAAVLDSVAVKIIELVHTNLAFAHVDLAVAIETTAAVVLDLNRKKDRPSGTAPPLVMTGTARNEIKPASAIKLVVASTAREI